MSAGRPSALTRIDVVLPWVSTSAAAELIEVRAEVAEMAREVRRLRDLASCVYCGPAAVHDLPENWLDALAAAAVGADFDCDSLIPYEATP